MSRVASTTTAGGANRYTVPGTQNAYELAKKYLNWNAADLKVDSSAVGLAMRDGITNHINCANFVSGILEVAGQIDKSQHNDGARALADTLGNDPNWEKTS